jgi:hypothetical protein
MRSGMAMQWGAKGGGGRKGAPRWGVGALYSRQRRWMTAALQRGNSIGEAMDMGKVAAAAI